MRYLLGLLFSTALFATTTLNTISLTAQQAIIQVRTDQGGSCTVKVSLVNSFGGGYAPIHDVDTSLFTGSDQCNRTGNVISAGLMKLIVGKRAAELSSAGIMKFSRSLQATTTYYYSITAGSDTLTGSFITGNIPTGLTRNDVRFDRNRPGEYNYPSMDWSAAGKSTVYVDPTSGIGVMRSTGPGELYPLTTTGQTFSSNTGGANWTGLVWSGTGVGSYLYSRLADPTPPFYPFMSVDALQFHVTLSGSAPGADVCLSNNGINCSGKAIFQPITVTPTVYTIGTTDPILNSWRNSPIIPSTYVDIQPGAGNVTKSGTAITWVSGALFNLHLVAGSIITLDGTDCVIASITNEKALVLSSSGCIADGAHVSLMRNWGILTRATGSGTLTVASPTLISTVSGTGQVGSSSGSRLCSPVRVMGPTGMGQVCAGSGSGGAGFPYSFDQNPLLWFGDDGTTNIIGIVNASPTGTTLINANCAGELFVWDPTVAGKYWCTGLVGASQVMFSVQYTGDYSAYAPADGSLQPGAIVTVESGDLDAMVSAFTASDPTQYSSFTSQYGWVKVGPEGDKIILKNGQFAQDSVSWVAIFDPATQAIVGAFSTYGGGDIMPNRWCALHAVTPGGNTTSELNSCNPMTGTPYVIGVSSGTLTSSLSTCPTNTVVPTLAGQTLCSAITLSSLTPLYMGHDLFGQSFRLGDEAIVQANGTPDGEIIRILTISGTTINVQRNARPLVLAYAGNLNHSGTLSLWAAPGAWHEIWWNYGLDAHAQGIPESYGSTVMEDPDSSDCHEEYQNDVFIVGCYKNENINIMKILRNGDYPLPSLTNAYYGVNMDAKFNGSQFQCGANTCQQHPTIGQFIAPAYEKPIWTDSRPYTGDTVVTAPGNVTHVTGDLYVLTAAATASMDYRLQGLLVLTGALPLVDVSPQVIVDTSTDAFKYCYVVITGDCHASSTVGEVYFNVPQLTSLSVFQTAFQFYPQQLLRDITITQNVTAITNVQQGYAVGKYDPFGTSIRRLGTAFAPSKIQSTYWNNRTLPTGSQNWMVSDYMELARPEILQLKLPAWPGPQSTNRGVFVPVPFQFKGVSGDTIRIRGGYAENGPPASLFCHDRQVSCATDGSGALPYVWTDETQHYTACSPTCTMNFPAISGRVLYYIVDRKNGATTTSSPLNSVLVP